MQGRTDEYRLQHWQEVMRERNASGLTAKAYCEKAGIPQNTYYYWLRKLREKVISNQSHEMDTEGFTKSGNKSGSIQKHRVSPYLPSPEIKPIPKGWTVCGVEENAAKESPIIIEAGQCRIKVTGLVDMEQLRQICMMLVTL